MKEFMKSSIALMHDLSLDDDDDLMFAVEINKVLEKCGYGDSLSRHSMFLTPLKILLSKKSLIEIKSKFTSQIQCEINTIDLLAEIDGPERVNSWFEYREPMQNGFNKMEQSEKLEDFAERRR